MIDFVRYTLPNGLRVIHNFDPTSSMVAVDVLYNTGARDESRGLTGIAHLFEHLMFGGSVNVERFDTELENAGGSNNAWTSNDFTNFYDIVPAANVETVFHLESDRMLGLSFAHESLEVQRSVVIEEFKQQCLNRPYGDMMHGLRGALYSAEHPYSWPVIGLEPAHIAKVTDDDVRRWFYSHYAPNNAVLAISGNLPYAEGRLLIEKWFGDIPSRPVVPRQLPAPGFPAENKVVEMTGAVPCSMVTIAIPMDAYGTRDYYVADSITDIMAAGRASRFFRHLIACGDSTVIDADASIMGSEHEGFMMMSARVNGNDPKVLEMAEKMMIDQLGALAQPDNVSGHELERVLNRFESSFAMSNLDPLSKAQNLAMAEMHGQNINDAVARQREVTTADIARVAARLTATPRVVVRYTPAQ